MAPFVDQFVKEVHQIASAHTAGADLLERKLHFVKAYYLKQYGGEEDGPISEQQLTNICDEVLQKYLGNR